MTLPSHFCLGRDLGIIIFSFLINKIYCRVQGLFLYCYKASEGFIESVEAEHTW